MPPLDPPDGARAGEPTASEAVLARLGGRRPRHRLGDLIRLDPGELAHTAADRTGHAPGAGGDGHDDAPAPDSGEAPAHDAGRAWDPDDLMAAVARQAALVQAWAEVRESAAQDGDVGVAVSRFEYGVLDRLARLGDELIEGRYVPDPVREASLPSGDGVRVLRIASVRDRVVERSLLEVLTPWVEPVLSPYCFAYRRGTGVKSAVAELARARDEGATHVLRTDVRTAFDRVPRRAAIDALRGVVPDGRVCDVVASLLARLDDDGLDGRGIPQGSAVSPLLLNLYLTPLDRAVLAAGLVPIRYADDLAVPTPGQRAAESVLDLVEEQLDLLGLEVNPAKTRVVAFDDGVRFLGTTLRSQGGTRRDDISHPQRMALYVVDAGGVVRIRDGRIRVDRDGATVASIAMRRVSQVVVQGRVGLSTPFLSAAARAGIDVVMLSESGGYVGRLSRRRSSDPSVRRAQFRAADDPSDALRLARGFVAGKLANLRVAVLRADRRGEAGAAASRTADALSRLRGYAAEAESATVMMGMEGAGSREYFQWWHRRIDDVWGFEGRQRRPPPDPVNAMLSYGYTILLSEVVSACEQAGLDPDVGFLHSDRWGRPSLALDLMEEWRPVLVDAVVARIVSTGQLRPEHFLATPGSGCRMTERARRVFVEAYERRLLTRAAGRHGREPYRRLLGQQARALAASLLDPGQPYQPHLWR